MEYDDKKRWEMGAFIHFIDEELTAERRTRVLGEHIGQHAILGSERHETSDPVVVGIITFNDATIRRSPDPDKP